MGSAKSILFAVGGFVAVIATMALIPSALSFILDPINKRRILAECAKAGCKVTEIKSWPNHYGIKVQKNDEEHYLKCRGSIKGLTWKGVGPEQL